MTSRARAGVEWWQWPTVLSLDAPMVVLAWQSVIAQVGRVRLEWSQPFVLAMSVWLAYAADRWIEGWRLPPDAIRTARHAFYQRWRWPIFVFWIAMLVSDLWVAVSKLSARELEAGWMMLPPVLTYLLSHQLVHRHRRWRAPKEALVAMLLGAGVVLFPLAHPGPYHRHLWPALLLFVLLCFANCVLISFWEREVDRSHGQTSLALRFGRTDWIHVLPWAIVLLACAFGFIEAQGAHVVAACVSVSAALLGLVDRWHLHLGRQLARVLADIALLTPLVAIALRGHS